VVDELPEIEFDHLPAPRAQGVRAFVSIMEGCSKYCSFCIVPHTRREVSRPFASVLEEVRARRLRVAEVTLLGRTSTPPRLMDDGALADLQFHPPRGARARHRAIRFTTSHPLGSTTA
jgi:tRNA-2-methylthio-N6-dimethylallyladenosine synthase